MQRIFRTDPEKDLDEYISMLIENVTLERMTTEQVARELTVFALTLLSAKPKAKAA